jgi:glycolate oxidase FAD binding subunit
VGERPADAPAAAALLAAAASEQRTVRPVGGRTKVGWAPAPAATELSTGAMGEILEHNEGDFTAVLGAGASLAAAQERFASAGQMLALDPPDGDGRATIGGVAAAADSGPLRHRYGSPRDLVLGVQLALSDGTVARAGSRVIKNVAGYDLAKLFCGSMGSLGVICELTVRLHPRPEDSRTARGETDDPTALARAARALAAEPLELDALDVRWDGEAGALLARAGGRAAEAQAAAAAEAMRAAGLEATGVEADDDATWADQRARQRGECVVKVSGLPSRWEDVFAAGGRVVGRAGLGLAWARIAPDPDALARLRERVAPCACTVLDGPDELRQAPPLPALMRRVKERFDPAGVLAGGPA